MSTGTWAIVPVKPLARAKSRLAQVLPAERRERLAAQLLVRTIRLLVAQPGIDGVAVVSRDPQVLALAENLGAQTIVEVDVPELNSALTLATAIVGACGAGTCLVVPADLPLLSGADLSEVLALAQGPAAVVLVPDRHAAGTNLLIVRPPGLMTYAYGDSSFAAHQRLAHAAGAAVAVYCSERTGLDLDTQDDLCEYLGIVRRLGVEPLEAVRAEAEVAAHGPRADCLTAE